jgi:hypothetical protein
MSATLPGWTRSYRRVSLHNGAASRGAPLVPGVGANPQNPQIERDAGIFHL